LLTRLPGAPARRAAGRARWRSVGAQPKRRPLPAVQPPSLAQAMARGERRGDLVGLLAQQTACDQVSRRLSHRACELEQQRTEEVGEQHSPRFTWRRSRGDPPPRPIAGTAEEARRGQARQGLPAQVEALDRDLDAVHAGVLTRRPNAVRVVVERQYGREAQAGSGNREHARAGPEIQQRTASIAGAKLEQKLETEARGRVRSGPEGLARIDYDFVRPSAPGESRLPGRSHVQSRPGPGCAVPAIARRARRLDQDRMMEAPPALVPVLG